MALFVCQQTTLLDSIFFFWFIVEEEQGEAEQWHGRTRRHEPNIKSSFLTQHRVHTLKIEVKNPWSLKLRLMSKLFFSLAIEEWHDLLETLDLSHN